MFRTIADFLQSWEYESGATLKLLRAMTDGSLAQHVSPDGRTLGFLAWHITTSIGQMMNTAGVPVHATHENEPVPARAAAIAQAYEKAAKAAADAIRANWTDDQLPGEIPMYGEKWTRGFTLAALIGHQCHHRGQMTVLMRQAGLKVPGIYGPAKEEWAAMGMPAEP